jgi:hypothetical protein
MKDNGEEEIKKLLQNYQDSNPEIRAFIWSKIIELNGQISVGLLVC